MEELRSECVAVGTLAVGSHVDVYTEVTSYEQTVRQTYPGYTIWKLSLTQHLWRGMDLTLAVDNLFNYRPDYYYSNSPTTVGTTCSVGLALNLEQFFKSK